MSGAGGIPRLRERMWAGMHAGEGWCKSWALRVVRGGDGEEFIVSSEVKCGQSRGKEESQSVRKRQGELTYVESLLAACQGSPPFPYAYETGCCCHFIDGEDGGHWYMAKLAFEPGLTTKILCFSLCLCLLGGAKWAYTGDEVSHWNWGDLGSTLEEQGNLSKWFGLSASFLPSLVMWSGDGNSLFYHAPLSDQPRGFPSGMGWQSIIVTLLTKKKEHGKPAIAF